MSCTFKSTVVPPFDQSAPLSHSPLSEFLTNHSPPLMSRRAVESGRSPRRQSFNQRRNKLTYRATDPVEHRQCPQSDPGIPLEAGTGSTGGSLSDGPESPAPNRSVGRFRGAVALVENPYPLWLWGSVTARFRQSELALFLALSQPNPLSLPCGLYNLYQGSYQD